MLDIVFTIYMDSKSILFMLNKKVHGAPGNYIDQSSTDVGHVSAEENVVTDTLSLMKYRS